MSSLRGVHGAATAALALALTLTLALGQASTAQAHPFGPPLTASVTTQGSTVAVSWTGAPDDWMALGDFIGAFAASTDSSRTGAEVLASSPQVQAYLMEHVAVSQGGHACTASWQHAPRMVEDGAQLEFQCPAPVSVVDVRVSALTDVNDAYRTVVTAGGQQVLFTAAQPQHTLDLSGVTGQDRTPVLLLSGAGAAVLMLGAGWAFVNRRGQRSLNG